MLGLFWGGGSWLWHKFMSQALVLLGFLLHFTEAVVKFTLGAEPANELTYLEAVLRTLNIHSPNKIAYTVMGD